MIHWLFLSLSMYRCDRGVWFNTATRLEMMQHGMHRKARTSPSLTPSLPLSLSPSLSLSLSLSVSLSLSLSLSLHPYHSIARLRFKHLVQACARGPVHMSIRQNFRNCS